MGLICTKEEVTECQGAEHVDTAFLCQHKHCYHLPILCKACAKVSKLDATKFYCKLCSITEYNEIMEQEEINPYEDDPDFGKPWTSCKLVFTAARDPKKHGRS